MCWVANFILFRWQGSEVRWDGDFGLYDHLPLAMLRRLPKLATLASHSFLLLHHRSNSIHMVKGDRAVFCLGQLRPDGLVDPIGGFPLRMTRMRFALAWGLVFALTVPALSFEIGRRPRRGQTIIETPPPVEPVKVDGDTWDAVYLDGQKAGYIHTTVREEKQDGKTVRKVQRELNLTVKRFGQLAEVKAQVGTSETPEGKVLGLSLTQSLGKNVKLALTGRVSGDRLLLTLQGESPEANREVSIPWDDAAIGLLGEENLLRDRRAKPGDKFSYRMFEPTVNNIVTTHVAVKNWETVPLNGVQRSGRPTFSLSPLRLPKFRTFVS